MLKYQTLKDFDVVMGLNKLEMTVQANASRSNSPNMSQCSNRENKLSKRNKNLNENMLTPIIWQSIQLCVLKSTLLELCLSINFHWLLEVTHSIQEGEGDFTWD